jgi:aminopeptidase-like protein
MINWIKDLFYICRSITGPGLRTTLSYFERINPEFRRLVFRTGKKVFDWKIPYEWSIKDAYILHSSGKKFADFSKNNLHIVNYSRPINKIISKKNLLKNIFTLPEQPNSIPYVTSYYKRAWGFCISDNQKKKLPNGNYKVFIDSSFKKGFLELSHALYKGLSEKEIFFSTYVCHPSMANNELSGPAVMNALMLYIKKNFKKTKYSYRFVMLPETIGSISYLSKYYKYLKKKVIAGFNLSCLGDDRAYSYISSPYQDTLADRALISALIGLKNVKKYSFLNRGSDERQYCSPGIELPVVGFCRSKYGSFKEYHTDKDNLNLVTQKGLEGSLEILKNIIIAFETELYPKSKFLCEPQLSRRGLKETLSNNKNSEDNYLRINIIAYSNGINDVFKIATILNQNIKEISKQIQILKKNKIL